MATIKGEWREGNARAVFHTYRSNDQTYAHVVLERREGSRYRAIALDASGPTDEEALAAALAKLAPPLDDNEEKKP